jgi:hypothetical protein
MRILRYFGLLAIVFGVLALAAPAPAQIAVGISVHVGPPALPVYAQPICPGDGYIWTPCYWAYGDAGYYWVPGTWVLAPRPGFLWTPGYWGWAGGAYGWHAGYWGPHIGFYGGINYGFGYGGVGFVGGEWRGGHFFYNSAVSHVNVTVIHNTYSKTVVVNNVHTSFNGGEGGVNYHASAEEERYSHEEHVEATHEQTEHEQAASRDPSFRASENHGHPAVAATSKPGDFHGKDAVAAHGAEHANAEHAAAEHHTEAASHSEDKHANSSSHSENKPKAEAKPKSESKPKSENKSKPKSESKPKEEKHPQKK